MQKTKKILIATDHAGFELKEILKNYLIEMGYEIEDKGAYGYHSEDDYPDFIKLVASEISGNSKDLIGLILGGSGQGEAITANRFKNVRAIVYNAPNLEIIRLSKKHNDANILSMGARFLTEDEAKEALKIWLETPFSEDGRHIRRIEKIEN